MERYDNFWISYTSERWWQRTCGLKCLIVVVFPFPIDPKWYDRVNVQYECMVSQDITYQIFATASSFYVPLFVILVLYWRIFQTARKRIRRRQQVNFGVDRKENVFIPNREKKAVVSLLYLSLFECLLCKYKLCIPTNHTTNRFNNIRHPYAQNIMIMILSI